MTDLKQKSVFSLFSLQGMFVWNFFFLVLVGFLGMHQLVFGNTDLEEYEMEIEMEQGENIDLEKARAEEGRLLAEKRKKEQLQRIEEEYEDYISRIEQRYDSQIEEKKAALVDLEKKLEKNYLSFDENKKKSEYSEEKVKEKSNFVSSLEEEIANINIDIEKQEKKIALFSEKINKKESDIAILTRHKVDLLEAKDVQKEMVLDFFKMYQVEDEEFLKTNEQEAMLEMLFTDKSVSEEILEIASISAIEKKSRESFYLLETATSRVKEATFILQEENQKLLDLKKKLAKEKEYLSEKKEEKKQLLSDNQVLEKKYTTLWRDSLDQMHQAALEVKNIKKKSESLNIALKSLEKKMKFEKRIITKDRIREKVLEEISSSNETVSVDELGKIFAFESKEYSPLLWPVDPIRGISAYFRDEEYKKIFKIDHNAIDIPVPQGTEVRAATAGYVYKAVDNGKGYSYIILLHRDNIRTVYGHISEILVKEGQMMQEGEVIGRSGGQPGTNGAGKLTTGPHLHFEVLEGEKWKNPLEYLPLDALPLE